MARHGSEVDEELHPVATDQPGLVLHQPQRKMWQIFAAFVFAITTCSAAAAYVGAAIAYHRASDDADVRFATLEKDLAERRKLAAEANAKRDAQQAKVSALVCTVLDRLQPRDADVEAARATYGCTANPKEMRQVPGAVRQPGGAGGSEPGPTGPGSAHPPAPPAAAPVPRPPTTTPALPVPKPSTPPEPLVCVPLLGCLG